MRDFETRKCLKCGHRMRMVDGSDRTTRDRVWFRLRCGWCGHEEMDWHERRNKRKEG